MLIWGNVLIPYFSRFWRLLEERGDSLTRSCTLSPSESHSECRTLGVEQSIHNSCILKKNLASDERPVVRDRVVLRHRIDCTMPILPDEVVVRLIGVVPMASSRDLPHCGRVTV